MKKIEAIIRPSRLEAVKQALQEIGVRGLTAWEVQGFGRQGGHREIYRGSELRVDFVPKTKVEIIIRDGMVEKVIGAVIRASRTPEIGDGKIFICDLDNVVRIRTGERGDKAV